MLVPLERPQGCASYGAARWNGSIGTLTTVILEGIELIIDALFGARLSRALEGVAAQVWTAVAVDRSQNDIVLFVYASTLTNIMAKLVTTQQGLDTILSDNRIIGLLIGSRAGVGRVFIVLISTLAIARSGKKFC